MADIKFTIECEMEARWVNHFMSMLKEMEKLGDWGSSRVIGFYSDGDGDFRPKFNTNIKFDKVEPRKEEEMYVKMYDAG